MAMTDDLLSIERMSKGSYRGYVVYGNIVELWFSSPTGDESDAVKLMMTCEDHTQAMDIATMHNKVWGLNS